MPSPTLPATPLVPDSAAVSGRSTFQPTTAEAQRPRFGTQGCQGPDALFLSSACHPSFFRPPIFRPHFLRPTFFALIFSSPIFPARNFHG